MKPYTKMLLTILGYCVLMWGCSGLYWLDSFATYGVSLNPLDPRPLGILISIFVIYKCTRILWRQVRTIFAAGIQIPAEARLAGDWGMLLYTMPIVIISGMHPSGTDAMFQMGGKETDGLSVILWMLAVVCVMLLQTNFYLREAAQGRFRFKKRRFAKTQTRSLRNAS